MEKAKTVCFTGHRRLPEESSTKLISELYSTVIHLILEGYDSFICGGAMGFDTAAAECVLKIKERYPHIKLILALPCRDQTMKWDDLESLTKYKSILGCADMVEYMQPFYSDGCMHKRNRWMVDHSDVCVAYLTSTRSGTAYTYNYAKKGGLRVINLADMTSPQLSFC